MSIIIGCDFHPGYQQIATMDMDSKEFNEKTLSHQKQEEVRTFYLTQHCSVAFAVRLYSMLRGDMNYAQLIQGSRAGEPGSFCGRS
jgi:hypothetical protein